MPKDPYLYPNSETLINLFDEHNEQRLEEIEADYTGLRLRQLCDSHKTKKPQYLIKIVTDAISL
jgi:fido (protein-threonine AMPylation protein)